MRRYRRGLGATLSTMSPTTASRLVTQQPTMSAAAVPRPTTTRPTAASLIQAAPILAPSTTVARNLPAIQAALSPTLATQSPTTGVKLATLPAQLQPAVTKALDPVSSLRMRMMLPAPSAPPPAQVTLPEARQAPEGINWSTFLTSSGAVVPSASIPQALVPTAQPSSGAAPGAIPAPAQFTPTPSSATGAAVAAGAMQAQAPQALPQAAPGAFPSMMPGMPGAFPGAFTGAQMPPWMPAWLPPPVPGAECPPGTIPGREPGQCFTVGQGGAGIIQTKQDPLQAARLAVNVSTVPEVRVTVDPPKQAADEAADAEISAMLETPKKSKAPWIAAGAGLLALYLLR